MTQCVILVTSILVFFNYYTIFPIIICLELFYDTTWFGIFQKRTLFIKGSLFHKRKIGAVYALNVLIILLFYRSWWKKIIICRFPWSNIQLYIFFLFNKLIWIRALKKINTINIDIIKWYILKFHRFLYLKIKHAKKNSNFLLKI